MGRQAYAHGRIRYLVFAITSWRRATARSATLSLAARAISAEKYFHDRQRALWTWVQEGRLRGLFVFACGAPAGWPFTYFSLQRRTYFLLQPHLLTAAYTHAPLRHTLSTHLPTITQLPPTPIYETPYTPIHPPTPSSTHTHYHRCVRSLQLRQRQHAAEALACWHAAAARHILACRCTARQRAGAHTRGLITWVGWNVTHRRVVEMHLLVAKRRVRRGLLQWRAWAGEREVIRTASMY